MKKVITVSSVILVLLLSPAIMSVLYAAPLPPVHAPIDGGVTILLGMGVLYGIRKLYKAEKK